jgi:L-alanine-DL-glutamate epimerase-like enolase superfamily enzyme
VDGATGLGEAAASPDFDGVTAAGIARGLRATLPPVLPRASEIPSLLAPLTPAGRCALDTAFQDLSARRDGLRVSDRVGSVRRERVPVNALLLQEPGPAFLGEARAAWEKGIRTFKIKSRNRAADLARLRGLREQFGGAARLRLDANGAWSHAEAVARLRVLADLDLEYVEQPLKPGDLAGMAALARQTAIPLAADEAATDAEAVSRIAAAAAAAIVVVKLPPAGGVTGAAAAVERAAEHGLGVVVTGMMETSVGLAAALHVAASAPSLAGACGLGTIDLLAQDVVREPLRIEAGAMILPESPGLGVDLDPEVLARFRMGNGGGDG